MYMDASSDSKGTLTHIESSTVVELYTAETHAMTASRFKVVASFVACLHCFLCSCHI